MLVAAGQFAVSSVWEKNAETCVTLMSQAAENGASLLVLPEALLARDDADPDLSVKSAQPVEGDFLKQLLRESALNTMTTILTVHVPSRPGRAVNTLVALRGGKSWQATPSYTSMMLSPFRSPGMLMRVMLSHRCLMWMDSEWG